MTRHVKGQRADDNGDKYPRRWLDADAIKIILALFIGSGGTGIISAFTSPATETDIRQIYSNKQQITTHINDDAKRYEELNKRLDERNERILDELKDIKAMIK